MDKEKLPEPIDAAAFQRMRKWYLLALAAIALNIVVAQILIQTHLNSQLDDSRVINVAGHQRAYSQKLVKEALLLQNATEDIQLKEHYQELQHTLLTWKTSHEGLQFGSDSLGLPKESHDEILVQFRKIEPHFVAMVHAAERLLKHHETGRPFDSTGIQVPMATLLENESRFLQLMDNIVNEYDKRSKRQLQHLKFKEYLLLALSFLVLLLEMLFIFRPLSLQIRNTIKNLLESQRKSEEDTQEIKRLYDEKEKSLQELQELNFVIDNAALFASTKSDGGVVFISKKFLELLGYDGHYITKPLSEVLTTDEGQQLYLREVFKTSKKSIRSEEIQIKTVKGEDIWLDMSIIPMQQSTLRQSILILCSNITERKKTQIQVARLTKENYEERIRQKQLQASQIVEGQEEERKRIAKDIHDGIGQMLTALKFNIESINLNNKEKSAEKIEYLKALTTDLIKGVRTATFNLTPPELNDHGILPAFQKMTQELSKLTGKNILFENKIDGNIRFNSLAETNIYRVAQEAVNNAIKYADSNYILLSVNFTNDLLSVVIDDDGKGFDDALIARTPDNTIEGGMGLFYMKERISYINGRLFINSVPGKGTRVTINYRTEENA
ncbi:type IV pili methyl-accepting chemotaxis transducer N-terminal domain-containing protein [Arenibacter sp. GZD96]|uniref:sensor histidine kinase n=1 Tax=Aurantibrevibacter litoralis TaxID=3106030 RepID=UPI002AFF18B0|nr:type IV pili methyl-accepting chemotaxis transducer N-terminal domain-containing protein [Arenibacter sp. GZD-96]MEA1787591.1 type IV pili methyl-accepting chemotaxis transducer N-terminal domain-containing protein [Arenibacter sp. GZD-96]